MNLVLDASVAVDALIPGPRTRSARRHMSSGTLVAPHLIDSEVLSALARLTRAGVTTNEEADKAVDRWTRVPCSRVDMSGALQQVWALRDGIRVSDAQYVVLARRLGAALLTSDGRLARSPLRGLSVLLVS